MKDYKVVISFVGSITEHVSAESEEEAREKAYQEFDKDSMEYAVIDETTDMVEEE